MLRHAYDVSNMDIQIVYRVWKLESLILFYPAKTSVCLSWILFGWPFDRKTNHAAAILRKIKHWRLIFSFNNSTFSFSLSPPWKRAKCSPRQSKIFKIFPGSMPRTPLQVCMFTARTHTPPPPPHTKNPGYAPVFVLLWFKFSPIRDMLRLHSSSSK